jgi:glycogen(starch) synthase
MVLNREDGFTGTALWVVPVANLAGVARHVLDVAGAGIPGWRLVVLCPDGPLAERLTAGGTAVVTGEFGPDAGFRASFRTLQRTVRGLNPDVVHSHLSYADVVAAAVLATDRRTRLVTTEHGIAADDLVYHGSAWKARVKAALHTVRLRRADATY